MVLNVLRSKKFAKRVLIALLILIIPAFVLWGVGSMSSGPELIGTIGGEKIYEDDFAASRQGIRAQLLFSHFTDQDTLTSILDNRPMMNYMAWERLVLLNAARNKKFKVKDQVVMNFIAYHPLFQRGGQFDPSLYEYVLRNNLQIEPRQFEELVKENLMVKAFRQNLLKDIYVSDDELSDYYQKMNGKVDLSYVVLSPEAYNADELVSEQDAKEYFESSRFMSPPKVAVEYLSIPYKTEEEKTEAVETLQRIYPELKQSPSKLGEIAKSNGIKTAETEVFSKEEVVQGIPFFKEFNQTAFSLGNNEASQPLFSSDGNEGSVYILRLTQRIESKPLTFEEVKEPIMNFLRERKRLNLAKEQADRLYGIMSDSGLSLEETALELNQPVQKAEKLGLSGYLEGAGAAKGVVFSALEKGEKGPIEPVVYPNAVVLAEVDEVYPAQAAAFEENKEALRAELLRKKQMMAFDGWLKQNKDRIKLNRPLEEL